MRPIALALAVAGLAGCAAGDDSERGGDAVRPGSIASALTGDQRRARVAAIRDVAGGLGLGNAPLLAGIAQSETGMAHCWSEATWACQGPGSPSCGGGPVIAGSG